MRLSDDRYVELVQLALNDAGIEQDANEANRLVAWSIKQGRNLPWYRAHEKRIIEQEGGYINVHQSVMAMTIGYMLQHPKLSLADAAMQAGDRWRADIRRQWDVGYGPVMEPASLDGMAEQMAERYEGMSPSESKDILVYRHGQQEEPPSPFDDTQMTDPRLIMAWELATPKERELLRMVADGISVQQASNLLGGTPSLGNSRMRALRQRLEKRHVKATGPAA